MNPLSLRLQVLWVKSKQVGISQRLVGIISFQSLQKAWWNSLRLHSSAMLRILMNWRFNMRVEKFAIDREALHRGCAIELGICTF
mmetsp:Transcript_13746/g.21928  ORF Transcript_13746/g.21928 Transcript_13746/m.21928 type:complete len:85 (-) Transcript_13746:78-332(-)